MSTNLDTAIKKVKNVVDNTIIQADRINALHTGKQNRPDDYNTKEECPIYEQCLLISDEKGVPHWWPIIVPDTVAMKSVLNALAKEIIQQKHIPDYYIFDANTKVPIQREDWEKFVPEEDSVSMSLVSRALTGMEFALFVKYPTDTEKDHGLSLIYGEGKCVEPVPVASENHVIAEFVQDPESPFYRPGPICVCKPTNVGIDGHIVTLTGGFWTWVDDLGDDCQTNCIKECTTMLAKDPDFNIKFFGLNHLH